MYEHLGYLQYSAITNNATMKNFVHMYFHIVEVYLQCRFPRNRIAGQKIWAEVVLLYITITTISFY